MAASLEGRVVVVTGGASGIGRATVQACAERGAQVVSSDLADSEGAAQARALAAAGRRVRFSACDVTREMEVESLMRGVVDEFGALDVLIAGAGVLEGAMVDIEQFFAATFDHVLDVNARGAFLCAKHAVRAMGARGGVLLLIASGAGVVSGSSSYAYGASKGAVHGLGLVLQSKLADRPIRVNTVAPGSIATALKLQNVVDVGRAAGLDEAAIRRRQQALGDPAGVALVLAFLASADADYVRGTVFTR